MVRGSPLGANLKDEAAVDDRGVGLSLGRRSVSEPFPIPRSLKVDALAEWFGNRQAGKAVHPMDASSRLSQEVRQLIPRVAREGFLRLISRPLLTSTSPRSARAIVTNL